MVRRYISVVSIRSLTAPFCLIGGRPVFPRPGRVGVVPTTAVMWFRRDLRLADNPALLEACESDGVLPLFVLDPALWGPAGVSRRWYLTESLRALDSSLRQRRAGLSVVRGNPVRQVVLAAKAVGATR